MRGVSKCSAVPTGPGVCPRAAPLGFSLKSSLSHSRGHGSGQEAWIRTGWIVVRLSGLDQASGVPHDSGPFSGRPAWRQKLEKLTCRSLLQQLGLEVIGSVARPPPALCFGIR